MNLPKSNVLLVEDDPKMPEVLAALLHDDNIVTASAATGAEALAKAQANAYDLVLLDIGLPDVNGFELLQQLKALPPLQMVPVIVLTAWNSTTDKLRGFELGAVDYLTKPFEPSELRARVRAALRSWHLQNELTQTNRELLAARIAAEAAARAKAEFLANMSHEIRTPLNGIIANIGFMLETPMTLEQQGLIETIYTSSDSLLEVINDILDFSKIDSGKMEMENIPFSLREVIETSLEMLGARAGEKKLDLAYQMEDGIPSQVMGDPARLKRIITNLVSNGIKFTHTGEVVASIKVLASPPEGKASEMPWYLHFSVRDTGIGIPVDQLSRLFKPFSQADASTTRKYGGTGLGLAISRKLVEAMGGKMWVESVPQRGSTFHFTLPLIGAPAHAETPFEGRQPQLADLRILIVDDNLTNCRILTLQTSKWGMISRGTQHGSQALEWLQAGESFDLAILDMQMPEMDGLMLASEIRKLPGRADLPLLLLTSMGLKKDHPDFQRAAISACLSKPIKPSQLKESLLRLVSGVKATAIRPAPPNSKADPNMAIRLPLRILLCEDNAINQKVALRLLKQLGYTADLAGNGLEALEALEKEPYDMVFMDVMMPEMNGFEATGIIRERQQQKGQFPFYKSSLIIVAMTASAMHGDREKCLEAGMDDYLAKPVRLEDIRALIERWGAVAAMTDTLEPPCPNPAPAGADPMATDAAEEPVDMSRLNEFTEGDPENLRELGTLYLTQTADQLEQLEAAVQSNNAGEVRRLAHSCAGASGTCGMRHIVPPLKELERQGNEGTLTTHRELMKQVNAEFDRVRKFLESIMAAPPPAHTTPTLK